MIAALPPDDSVRRAEVMAQLRRVIDPELGLDIVSVGLVYEVGIDAGDVTIVMTLTTRGCPMQVPITEGVRRVLCELPWVATAEVRLTWSPQWTPERIQR